jgi:hypothetical protein
VDYDHKFDAFLDGRGTTTLQLTGFEVTLDALSLTGADNGGGVMLTAAEGELIQRRTLRLLPEKSYFVQQGQVSPISFGLQLDGRFSYAPADDTTNGGALSGAGTTTLTFKGHPVSVDASAVSRFLLVTTIPGAKPVQNGKTTVVVLPAPGFFLQLDSGMTDLMFSVGAHGEVMLDPTKTGRLELLAGNPPTIRVLANADCSIQPTGPIAERWFFLDGAKGPLGCPVSGEIHVEGQKDLPGEKTEASPAVAVHAGHLFLAWRGTDGALNMIVSNDDGASFTGKRTFGETTDAAPALASHNGHLFIAWRGSGNNDINIARVSLFANTNGEFGIEELEGKVTLDERTDLSPAIASHGGRLFLAWKGSGNDQINLRASNDDGATFPVKRVLDETTDKAPSLASSGDRLLIAWEGSGNDQINVAQIGILANTGGGFGIEGTQDKVVLGEKTDEAPALAVREGRVFLAWKGSGNKQLNLMFARPGTMSFEGKRVLADTSENGPTLASDGRLWVAWRGVDNDLLNVGKAILFGNTAGGFGIERLEGRDAIKMKFDHGEVVWSPAQGPKMVVAAYQQDDHVIVNWGDTSPWNYDRFLISWTRNGQPQPQVEVFGFIERSFGFHWIKSPLPAVYTFSVEGCAVGIGGHDCPQRWTLPVEVEYRLPPLPAFAGCENAPKPQGLIAQKWAELGGSEGRLGCAVGPEHPVAGSAGRAQSFEHGEITFSPEQGEQMMLAVYQDGWQIVADWGSTEPFVCASFGLTFMKNGQLIAAPLGLGGATGGKWSMGVSEPGNYSLSVMGQGGLDCPQGSVIPATATFTPPPPDTDCPIKPTGLIGDRWTRIGAKSSPIGCPTSAEENIPGRNGRRMSFENGEILVSPDQGTRMVVSAFQDNNGINVDWGDTDATDLESFLVDVTFEGQAVGQHEVAPNPNKTSGLFRIDFKRPEDDASVPTVGNGTGQYTIRVEGCKHSGSCPGRDWTAPVSVQFRTTAAENVDLSDLDVPVTVAAALENKSTRGIRAARAAIDGASLASNWGNDEVGYALAMLYVTDDVVAHGAAPGDFRRKGQRFSMLSEINEALRNQFPRMTGTAANSPFCTRDGDYDAVMKGLAPMLYRYGKYLAPDVRYRMLFLLSTTGPHEKDDESYLCTVTVPETENHLWMIDSSRYLANQLWAKRSRDPKYDNKNNGLADYLIGKLQGHIKSDFIEYNSRPYTQYTLPAIENLYDFAEDVRVKTAAQIVLDYLSLKGAVSTSEGRRNPPYRRRVSSSQADYFNPQADQLKKFQLVYSAPTAVMRELKKPKWLEDFARGDIVLAAQTSYQPPNLILDLLVNPFHRTFYQRFNHSSVEVYASEPDFLISAGGTRTDYAYASSPGEAPVLGGILGGILGSVLVGPAGEVVGASGGAVVAALVSIHGLAEDLGFVQPTVLIPTSHFTSIKQMIRFDGVPSQVGHAAACVAPGFACGGRPVIPSSYTATAQCRIISGNWTFVDFSSDRCREATPDNRKFGFFAAVHGDGKAFGMLEAVPKAKLNGVTLQRFADSILAKNRGRDFTTAGEHTYSSFAGNEIRFTLGDSTAVLSTGLLAVDAEIAASSRLASGSIANSDGSAMTIVNPFTGDSLRLDLSEPRNPIRVLNERDLLGRLLAAGVDFSVPEADIRDWVVNNFTPYPAFSGALLTLLNNTRLRKLVYIDVIAFDYEHSPGARSPRSAAEVDVNLLKASILAGHNERYGETVKNFDDLLAQ